MAIEAARISAEEQPKDSEATGDGTEVNRTTRNLVIGASLFGGLIAATRRASAGTRTTTMPSSSHEITRILPSSYVRDYASTLDGRWAGQLGTSLRSMTPRSWPSVPGEAFCGFTITGRQTEDQTGTRVFHEIGLFQTPAGPVSGPAPAPLASAARNEWGALADSSLVRQLLGHSATMAPNAWKENVADQTAVGLAMLRSNAASANAILDPSIRFTPYTHWHVCVAFSAFSAGPTGAARHWNRYKDRLARVDEANRFKALLAAIADEWCSGGTFSPAHQHGNRAWTAIRTWQKIACGKALAERHGGDFAWFDVDFGGAAATRTVEIAVAAAGLALRP